MTARLFWPSVVVGWTIMIVGLVGVAGEGHDVPFAAFGRWTIGLALLHDLVAAPIVLGVGALLHRTLHRPWRTAAAATLVAATPVVLFAWPFVAGWGRSRSNASIQPRSYGDGLVIVLAVLAAAGGAAAVIASWRARRACRAPLGPSRGSCP